jgi:3-(3-hydroxy-phenyl)propionate hydroxylase
MVNSGRLSRPTCCPESPLHARSDGGDWGTAPIPGDVLPDAPLANGTGTWATEAVAGRFAVVTFADSTAALPGAPRDLSSPAIPVECLAIGDADRAPAGWTLRRDRDRLLARRCDARPGTTYLVRPDQVIAGRWRSLDVQALAEALRRATGH